MRDYPYVDEYGVTNYYDKLPPEEQPVPQQQTGEIRTTSATGGQKGVKPERVDLIPPEFLLMLGRVFNAGAEKYDDHNYLKGFEWSKSYAALQRHMLAFWSGEDNDPETGQPHLGHAAFHCAALFMFTEHDLGTDDRKKLNG